MMGLTVKPVDGETDCYGKNASMLQEGIVIGDKDITGTSKHVTDYAGFNANNPEEQRGNYLALAFSFNDGVTVKTKVVGGKNSAPVDCTADKFCVYRLTDNQTQSIQVIAEKNGKTLEKTYGLTGLTLQN